MSQASDLRMERTDAPALPAMMHGSRATRAEAVAAARALIARLAGEELFQHPSFLLEVAPGGSLSVEFQGQLRGQWCWNGEIYIWTPVAGGACHYTADDAGSAARLSAALLTHLPPEDELYLYRAAANDKEF